MSAAEILALAAELQITIALDGGEISIRAPEKPPEAVLGLLRDHKRDIVHLLTPGRLGWSEQGWRAYYDERVAFNETSNGLTLQEAQKRALECCVALWMDDRNTGSVPGSCAHCGGPDSVRNEIQAIGTKRATLSFVHRRCWPEWYAQRKDDAAAALSMMGLAGHCP